jgi:hypothetical protein
VEISVHAQKLNLELIVKFGLPITKFLFMRISKISLFALSFLTAISFSGCAIFQGGGCDCPKFSMEKPEAPIEEVALLSTP